MIYAYVRGEYARFFFNKFLRNVGYKILTNEQRNTRENRVNVSKKIIFKRHSKQSFIIIIRCERQTTAVRMIDLRRNLARLPRVFKFTHASSENRGNRGKKKENFFIQNLRNRLFVERMRPTTTKIFRL